MRKLAVSLLVAGLAVLLAPFVPTASATTAVPTPKWLELTLDSIQPSVVTASDTSVLVTGKITNISDRRISDLTIRMEAADALTSGSSAGSALASTYTYTHGHTAFVPVTGSLDRGQTAQFSVIAQLRGSRSLNIDSPGVYPVMVNVQGVPDYSTTGYRLAVGTMLLPVLAAPGGQAPSVPPATSASHLTVLWPLLDGQPRVVGTSGGQIVLSDDSLATSLGSGGRLFGLLDAASQATRGDPALLSSLCFAVDPDLLDTVQQMASGYRVRTASGATVAGQGAAAANLWLHTLQGLANGRCALVLPYADADLAALTHAGGTSLLQLALSESTSVADLLGARRLANVAWPADGSLDTATMKDLAGLGVNTVLLAQGAVPPPAGPTPVAGFTGGAAPKVVPIDPVVAAAMGPRTDEPYVDHAGVWAQDGLAAMIYQTVFGDAGQSVLVAPPRRWSPSESQAQQFLAAASDVLSGHYAQPTTLTEAAAVAPAGQPAALAYPPLESVAEVAHQVVTDAVAADSRQRDVQSSMGRDPTTPNPVLPSKLITPLRLGLLRAVSSAWRDGGTHGAQTALVAADAQFNALTGAVSVVQPSLPILLGSAASRLPVTVRNRLPVDVKIQVDLTGEPGLPSSARQDLIPAGGSVTVFIPATVTRSGRFSVYATVRTLGGTQLGQQARIELVSSAYGTIVLIVTAIAFGLLVLLSGRRIYRRVRAARAATVPAAPDPEAVGALVGVGEPVDRQQRREPNRP